jgi:hypothetical protein
MDANERKARGADDDLEARLGRTLADPAPPDLKRVASELLCWRTVEADVAALLRTPAPAD